MKDAISQTSVTILQSKISYLCAFEHTGRQQKYIASLPHRPFVSLQVAGQDRLPQTEAMFSLFGE